MEALKFMVKSIPEFVQAVIDSDDVVNLGNLAIMMDKDGEIHFHLAHVKLEDPEAQADENHLDKYKVAMGLVSQTVNQQMPLVIDELFNTEAGKNTLNNYAANKKRAGFKVVE